MRPGTGTPAIRGLELVPNYPVNGQQIVKHRSLIIFTEKTIFDANGPLLKQPLVNSFGIFPVRFSKVQ